MSVPSKLVDLGYMARDFAKIWRGTDYFHNYDHVGNYFADGRSYYVDFEVKTGWTGEYRDGVPVLFVPSLGDSVFFPGMIIQYGLGCIDSFYKTENQRWIGPVRSVTAWLIRNCNDHDYYNNLSRELNKDPRVEFHSNNSAMTQGMAISFLLRAAQSGLLTSQMADQATSLCARLYANMILPLDKGGSTLYADQDVLLCEYCRTDGCVVLNGWVFALLGVRDWALHSKDPRAEALLNATIQTLERSIENYLLPNGWSYYDNKRRVVSHTYQMTHIHQTDILHRLTGAVVFDRVHRTLSSAYTLRNRVRYTAKKIRQKLKDRTRYSTVR